MQMFVPHEIVGDGKLSADGQAWHLPAECSALAQLVCVWSFASFDEFVIISSKEVMFSLACVFVCLFVCLLAE